MSKADLKCQVCGEAFKAEVPKERIENSPSVSAVVAEHPRPAECPECGLLYVAYIREHKGLTWSWILPNKETQEALRKAGRRE